MLWELNQDRCALLAALADSLLTHVTTRTSRKEIHELGIYNRIAVKKPSLNDKSKARRLAFAREHVNWTIDD